VVRDYVLDPAHVPPFERLQGLSKLFDRAYFRVQVVVVYDIVAVKAPGPGLENRRGVYVGYAEGVKVADYVDSVFQAKGRIELEPVGRRWDAHTQETLTWK